MQALVWEGPRLMNMRDVAEPKPDPNEVVIKVAYSGICGSELGGYLGENSLRVPPLVMGHEFSGEVIGLGSQATQLKPDLSVGQRVAVNPLVHCGQCRACLTGQQNLCRDRKIVGIHRPGSFADLVTAPAPLVYPLPDSLSDEHAALAEPVGCAIRAVKLAGCSALDSLLITGLGPIGLLSLQVAQTFGLTKIYATDTDPDRRAIGQQFGVQVVDPLAENVVDLIQTETKGEGVDAAIDAVGTESTRKECIDAIARGGRVVFIGLHAEESEIQSNLIIRSEIVIQGSFAYTSLDFQDGLDWLIAGHLKIDPWLLKAPLAEGGACFERLLSKPGPVAKILLHL